MRYRGKDEIKESVSIPFNSIGPVISSLSYEYLDEGERVGNRASGGTMLRRKCLVEMKTCCNCRALYLRIVRSSVLESDRKKFVSA